MRNLIISVIFTLLFASIICSADENVESLATISSNRVAPVELRRIASEQQTNTTAWLRYGHAAWAEQLSHYTAKGQLPSTNDFNEAISALETGLRLNPKDFQLNREIAQVYENRSRRNPLEEDETRYSDLERALEFYSVALRNAPIPFWKEFTENRIHFVTERIKSLRQIASEVKAFEQMTPEERNKESFASDRDRHLLSETQLLVHNEPTNVVASRMEDVGL